MDYSLGDWQPIESAFWEIATPCFSTQVNIIEVVDRYINPQLGFYRGSTPLIDSYRSYLIQTVKDVDCVIQLSRTDKFQLDEFIAFSIDMTLANADPWKYTGFFIKSLVAHPDFKELCQLSNDKIWDKLDPLLEQMLSLGGLYRLEKYVKVAHVLLDIAFDIGWDARFNQVFQLKQRDGLDGNPERAASLREVSLFIARNFWFRGYLKATKEMLLIGFPDVPEEIESLDKYRIEELFLLTPQEAVLQLLKNSTDKALRDTSSSQIVKGALRVMSAER